MDEPFVMVPVRLLKDKRLRKSPLAATVYGLIFKHERKRKASFIGRKRLATEAGCSLDTVDRAVRLLVETGWVIIERKAGKTHNWHRGDGRTGAASNSRTDAAPVAAPVRHEVDPGEVEEELSRSIRVRSEHSRQLHASRQLREEVPPWN